MRIRDTIAVTDYALTGEGYLHVEAVLARTGIQEYAGYEVGKQDDATYRVYRAPEDVFDVAALASFAYKPVTDGHPWDGVTASNWRKEAVGLTMPGARQDGEHVAGGLMISDAEIINRVQREDRVELSCGYDCALIWESGVTADGETYDARQIDIKINHVAIVDRGRCGPACAIASDRAPGSPKIVMLHASSDTQRALRAWATTAGFDLTRAHGGAEVHVADFGFHTTVLATTNPITLPAGEHEIAPVAISATGFGVLGADNDTPVLKLDGANALGDLRAHYLRTYRAEPTFPDYKPHLSLSYSWPGAPALDGLAVPEFPLVFDRLVISDFVIEAPKATAADGAASITVTDCSGRCTCTRNPQPTTKGTSDMTTKTVTIDGKSFEVAADVAAAIEAAQRVADKTAGNLDLLMERTEAVLGSVADKAKTTDAELAAKDAEIDALKAKIMTPDQLNAALDARAKLIADAHSIAPEIETVGKSADEIRQAALAACLGDRAPMLDGKSAAYIEAAFDARVENAGERLDPTVVAVARGTTAADGTSPDKARAAHMAAMSDAWKATA